MLKKANIQWSGKQLFKKVMSGDVFFDCTVQRVMCGTQAARAF